MLTDSVWCVLEAHLALLARKNQTALRGALEQRFRLVALINDFLPFELVARVGWIDSHEAFGVLDVCA